MGCADGIGITGMALESTAMGDSTVITLNSIPMEPSCRKVITLIINCTDIILFSMKMEASMRNPIGSMVWSKDDDDEEEEEQEEAEEEEELLKSSRACCCPLAPLKIYHIVWTCMRCTRGVCF